MQPINVGLLGLGTVGGGTINVLGRNAEEITRRAGRAIQVVAGAARDLEKERSFSDSRINITDDPYAVVNDPGIDVICELIGGTEPARDLVLKAIASGKHVVTANKALIALHGNEVFDAAQRHGVIVAFEAAVAGGIPIIKALREALSGNRVESVVGIINGTSNYVLSEMSAVGIDFVEALAAAQKLGYAEANPDFDVSGIDAAHKLTILASIAFGIPLQFDRVHIEGITGVTGEDMAYAAELGYRIKHLGIGKRHDDSIELRVHPTLVPVKQLLANVNGAMNAIQVVGDAVGPTLYYGAGAGAEPTASAVVADLVDVVRATTSDPENRVPHLAFQPDALSTLPVRSIEVVETAYYLRLYAIDRPGVLANITAIFGELGISIEAIIQKEPRPGTAHVPIIFLTQRVLEKNMIAAVEQIEQLESVDGTVRRLRLEHLQ